RRRTSRSWKNSESFVASRELRVRTSTSPKGFGNMSSRTRLSALLARTGLPRVPPSRSRPKYLRTVRPRRPCFRNSSLYEPTPRKKIVTILEMMLEIEEMTRPIAPEEPMIVAVEWEKTDPNKYKLHWEIEKRTALLERELSRYRFSPRAEVAMGGGGKGLSV